MSQHDAAPDGSGPGVSVGIAAARLGVTASTLRSWGTRYGIAPSLRTKGGHRRYSESDLRRLDQVQADIQAGMTPAAAAAAVLRPATAPANPPAQARRRRGAGPGGRVLAVPGAGAAARGLARATVQLDLDAAEEIVLGALRESGVLRTWDELMQPVLVAVGKRWAESGQAIEVEHVLSEAALGALRRRRVELPSATARHPVLLAAAPRDQHTLTLHVLAAGLAEHGQSSRVLGAQVPVSSLVTAVRRMRPSAVFVSCAVLGAADPTELAVSLPQTRPPTPVVVGGDGWPRELPPRLLRAVDLAQALDLLGNPS